MSVSAVPFISRMRAAWFTPVLASLLRQRAESFFLVGLGGLQAVASVTGYDFWDCPIRAATGVPCPGCGLTRAMDALLHGNWREALQVHAFAPIFLIGFVFIAVVTFLPVNLRLRVIDRVAWVEQHTGLTTLLLLGLIFYWGLRLFG